MRAARLPIQRPANAKLLTLDRAGHIRHRWRVEFVDLLRPGDLVIANDAATLPASLSGSHAPTGLAVEVRLAGSHALAEIRQFSAVVFGAGDFRMRTEDRPQPPAIRPGDGLELGPLRGIVTRLLDHPRFILLRFEGTPGEIREGLARHGRPIQYSHVPAPLDLWDTWTPIAGPPVAFEPPSAGFILSWSLVTGLAARGVGFATITHAAGISSTGDAAPDARLPFDEPCRIPESTALAIRQARARRGRIVAIGTTVVRALEHVAGLCGGEVRAGEWVATQRVGSSSRLRIVDAILSGTHERGSSHYEMLRAFADDATLARVDVELNARDYRTHEFGDSVFLQRVGERAAGRTSHTGEIAEAGRNVIDHIEPILAEK